MSHYDEPEQKSTECLRYDVQGKYWFAHIGTTYIRVPGPVYERLLTAYLEAYGITRRTYTQIFSEAENTWFKQVGFEMEFRKDWQLWLFSDAPGIYVRIGE